MLIPQNILRRIAAGEVDLAFRRWRRPTVRAGGTLRTAIGVLDILAVDEVRPAEITAEHARRAGHPDRDHLLRALDARVEGTLYRIRLRPSAQPDPRVALRERVPDTGERARLLTTLARMDARSERGAWTARALGLIAERPGVRAAELAAELGWPTQPFKTSVRKLKELGLTESLEVGYRLSTRGQHVYAVMSHP